MNAAIKPNPAVMRVMKKYTAVVPEGDRYEVEIKIDHQSFRLRGVTIPYSRDTADWFRWQLAIALERMIGNERKRRP